MKKIASLVLALLLALTVMAVAAEAPKSLPVDELTMLKVENILLKINALDQQRAALTQTLDVVVRDARSAAKVPDGYVLDFPTRAWIPKPADSATAPAPPVKGKK